MQTPCGDLVARQGAIPEAEEHQGIRRLALCSLRLDHEERMKFWTSSVLQAMQVVNQARWKVRSHRRIKV